MELMTMVGRMSSSSSATIEGVDGNRLEDLRPRAPAWWMELVTIVERTSASSPAIIVASSTAASVGRARAGGRQR